MDERSNQSYNHYLELLNIILVEIRCDQTISVINQKGCELLGYTQSELIGKNWFDLISPDYSKNELKNIFTEMVSNKIALMEKFENEVVTKSGKQLLIGWTNNFLKNEKGEIIALVSMGEDISNIRSFEAALEAERDKAQSYLDIAEIIIMVLNPDQKILLINRKGCSLLKKSEYELNGQVFETLLPENFRPEFQAKFIEMSTRPLEESIYYEADLEILNSDNLLIAWRFKVLRDEDDKFTGLLGSGTDITEQRRADDLLKRQRDLAFKLNTLSNASDGYNVFIDLLLGIPDIDQASVYTYDSVTEKLKLNNSRSALITPDTIVFNNHLHEQYFELLLAGQTLHLYHQILTLQFPDKQTDVKSIVVVPILFEKHLIATLDIASTAIAFFPQDMLQALESLAAQFGNALIQLDTRQNLLTSEGLNRGVLENISIGILLIDTDYKIMTSNKQIRTWYPELVNSQKRLCYNVLYDMHQGPNLATCAAAKTFRSGQKYESVINVELKKNTCRFFRSITSPIFDESTKTIVAVVQLVEDITEKRNIDEAMRSMHLRTSQILASIPSVLIGLDNKNNISDWNEAAEITFGIPKSKAIGTPFLDLSIPWSWPEELKSIRKIFSTEDRIYLQNVSYTRTDETIGFLEISITRMQGTGKIFSEFLLIANDVTETRSLQTHLLQAQKLESVGQLAAGIAHEINTPIQYVGDNVRFLEESFLDFKTLIDKFTHSLKAIQEQQLSDDVIRDLTETIKKIDLDYLLTEYPSAVSQSLEGVERVATIVRALKGFAHPDDATEIKPININQAIENTATVARNEWKYIADLETNFDNTLPEVPCYPGEFNQVILNLLVNAAHTISDALKSKNEIKGKIIISTTHDSESVEIRIQDTGLGIPKAIRDKIFDPFFTTKAVGAGTGQGLAISRSVIVEKHHGTLTFVTKENVGTTFIIHLPLEQQKETVFHD